MKTIKNKIILVVAIVALIAISAVSFIGCQGNGQKVIGIIQYGSHQSLVNCYDGMIKGLKEGGIDLDNEYKVELLNSNFDASVSGTQAKTLVNKNVSMIGAIATPSAIAAATSADGLMPVIYCAVSDPVVAGLTKMENVAGSRDLLDFEGQMKVIKKFIPDVKKIGVLYSLNEDNSKSQIKTLKEVAAKYNVEIVDQSITNPNEIPTATDTVINKGVDCITNLTDNAVVDALDVIFEKTNAAGIPVFGSEIEQVKKGCLASASLDYVELGRKTGLLMAEILKGNKTADKSVIEVDSSFNCYNSKVAEALKITVPSDIDYKDVI